jgi:hypothetical protein
MNIHQKVFSPLALMVISLAVSGLAACGGGGSEIEQNNSATALSAESTATGQDAAAQDQSVQNDTEQAAIQFIPGPMNAGHKGH